MRLMQHDQTMRDAATPQPTRRRLFEIIGASVGAAAAYQAMTRLGYAEESPYRGPIRLEGDPEGRLGRHSWGGPRRHDGGDRA